MALEIFTTRAVSVLLLVCGVEYAIGQQGSGVHFSLNGIVYFNNSVIPITDIGTEGSTTPLMCNTNLRPCCIFRGENPLRVEGHWHYPNGTEVSGNGKYDIRRNFFRTRGEFDGTANIFRRSADITSPFGRYCCEIPNAMMENQTLCANLASTEFSFVINDGGATPTEGQNYSLTCSVTGGTVSSYQWRKDGAVLPGQTTEMLSFSPLRLSDAGRYSCEINVTAASETFTAIQNQSIFIQIPAPTSVSITSNPASPIWPVPSDVTLTCNVTLSQAIMNLPLNVTTVLTGPAEFMTTTTAEPVMESTTTYTSTAMVGSFGRDQSGNYNCTATVTSVSPFFINSNSHSGAASINIVSVEITGSAATPIAGESYSLTCDVSGVSVTTYQWRKNGTVLDQNGQTLSFSTLRLSDAGHYTCNASVNGIMYSNGTGVTIEAPVPNSVRITSIPDSPVRSVGTDVTLTCTVDLDLAVDVPVTVNTVWTGPDGVTLSPTDPVMVNLTRYTSTAMVSSFGRDQSGVYNCTATVSSTSSFISVSSSSSGTARVSVGVYLSHNGTVLGSNSNIIITDIGTSSQHQLAVVCTTDRMPCCQDSPQHGEWTFPNGTVVTEKFTTFRRNRDNNGNVNLYRVSSDVMSPTGRFCCEIEDATPTNQTMCVNIVPPIFATITGSTTTPTVGQSYTLNCTLSGVENTLQGSVYQWKKNGAIINGRVEQTLSFFSLTLSDAGQYSCMVTVNVIVYSATKDVSLQVPTPSSVTLSSDPDSPIIVGSAVTLTCTVELDPAVVESDLSLLIVDTRLSRDGSTLALTGPTVTNPTITYTIPLEPFGRDDSGNYTCIATITPRSTPTYLTGNVSKSSIKTEFTTGVYLSFNDRSYYNNNSEIIITRIGTTKRPLVNMEGAPLLCYTDNAQCCNSSELGRWFLPNGLVIGTESDAGDFYIERGQSVISLNRRNNATSPTGRFCCEVPNARSINNRVCANIVSSSTAEEIQHTPIGAIVGVVVAILIVLIAIILIIVVIFVLRRHRGQPYYEVSSTKTPVAYTRSKNGEQVQMFGVSKNVEPHIIEFPSDTSITEGEGVYFKIKVSGVPQPTVTWYHNGEAVTADYAREIEADGSLAIPSAELKHSGVYKAVVVNQHGSEERELKLTVNEEGGASTAATSNGVVSTRPIPIPEFGKYVAELHANSNQPFKDLYQALDSGEVGHTRAYATSIERKPLNRFGNIVVYDDNRIALQPLVDVPDCEQDYINASYIDGYSVPGKFIATQGPLPKTVVDFWRLIWQERPPTIIMVTNVKEGNRIKCQQYWPDTGQAEFGPFQVIITDQQVFADYTVRTLSLSLGSGRSHKVTQYHFTAWPDHGVPDYATPILAFHKRVKAQHHPSRGPMVVHCSAGVGRTGTFIVIDNILEQIEKEQVVDIPGAITKIRQKRMKMVQTHEQFTFIHDAILESVTCGDTQIAATNLRAAISKLNKKDGFQYQMKILEQVSPNPNEVHCDAALNFPERNRGTQFLPADRWRVILKGEQPDYIHAVTINGYKHQKAFIIAQGPMESTVRNFWKMIYDRKCAVVVMVSGLVENRQEASAQYWPGSGVAQYGEYAVDLLGEEPLEGFTIRELSVMDNKTQKAHKVTQFHITCWTPDGHCSNLKSVTDVIEEMTKVQIRSGNKPIVVHCNDTATRSGMFCAIATTIERCKTEGVVDVFQVVKALRVQKPGAVPTVDQYKFIFETALVFLESFDTYANFQM